MLLRLRELGWIEGRTIEIEYRWSEGRPERYAEIAAEFVRLKVDVIVTVGSAVPIVKQATSTSQLYLQWRSIPLAAAWSQVWQNRAATLLGSRFRRMSSLGSDWNSCVKSASAAQAGDFV